MTTSEHTGKHLNVRSKWPHEALDFTPWLAENLDLLGEATGMSLEPVRQEAPVGPFFCDILAKESGSGSPVVIENQLEWSDHSHLTQMLTYAAGLDARVGIWVAPEFRYEHAQTVHWLNQRTREELRLHAVKVELVQIGGGLPKPRFRTVVSSERWDKGITQPPAATMPVRAQQFDDYFRPLIAELRRTGFADKAIHHFDRSGRRLPSGVNPGVAYAAGFTEGKNTAWVSLYIQMSDGALTKRTFDELMANRETFQSRIEDGVDGDWGWNRHDRFTFSSINVRMVGSIDDPPEKLDETRAWMLSMLAKFKEVFDPFVQDMLAALTSAESRSP